MVIKKSASASRSYGRGGDNYRSPALYAVLDDSGARIGMIMGSNAGYMERSQWEVLWLNPTTGMPRVVRYAKSFKEAKAWAEAWDGNTGVRPEWR
jgi:hypothetical protein